MYEIDRLLSSLTLDPQPFDFYSLAPCNEVTAEWTQPPPQSRVSTRRCDGRFPPQAAAFYSRPGGRDSKLHSMLINTRCYSLNDNQYQTDWIYSSHARCTDGTHRQCRYYSVYYIRLKPHQPTTN